MYGGVIENKESNSRLALINIQGSDYLMEEGDVFQEIKLLKIYGDSVKVGLRKEYKVIPK